MSDKKRWPRLDALKVAGGIVARLTPCCSRIEVAGSLRRGKIEVGDVEILYIPKVERRRDGADMFAWVDVDLATEELGRLVAAGVLGYRPNVNGNFTWGIQNKLAVDLTSGIPVDFFATSEENFWVSLVIRTGPKEFNIRLINQAAKHGLKLHAYGVFERVSDSSKVVPKSEQDVFSLAGMEWLAAEDRC